MCGETNKIMFNHEITIGYTFPNDSAMYTIKVKVWAMHKAHAMKQAPQELQKAIPGAIYRDCLLELIVDLDPNNTFQHND